MTLHEDVKNKNVLNSFLTLENRFIIKHGDKYNYSCSIYNGNNKPICISCNKHGEIFYQTPKNHLIKSDCSRCTAENVEKLNSIKQNQFIAKSNVINNSKYDYSKVRYQGINIKVTIICPEHGEFKQTPDVHLRGCGCPRCGGLKSNIDRRLNSELFIERAKSVHNTKYSYDKVIYIDYATKISIICQEHGTFQQLPYSHLSGAGCPLCGNAKISENLMHSTETFIYKAQVKHDNRYDYSKTIYTGMKNKVEITCNICKLIFNQTPDNHLNGAGCPSCAREKSVFEKYKNKKTLLYYITINNKYFKIGLTQKNVMTRFKEDIKNGAVIEVIKIVSFEDGMDGYTLEQMILKRTIDLQVTKEDSPISVGWTEVRNCCIEPTFDECIQLYTKYKKEKNEKNK